MNGMMHHVGSITLPEPNTFIGGIGGSINTPTLLATHFDFDESDVVNFSVDANNNVSFFIDIAFMVLDSTNGFQNMSALTYFISKLNLRINTHTANSFRNTNLTAFYCDNFNTSANFGQVFRDVDLIKYINLKDQTRLHVSLFNGADALIIGKFRNVTRSDSFVFTNTANLKHLDLRNCITYATTNGGVGSFETCGWASGTKIYVPSSVYSSPPANLSYAVTNYGAILVEVVNETAPNSVSDLSVSNITSSSVDLNFTIPSSTNTIQHYEVWIERQDLDQWHKDRVVQIYTPKELITASGATISGLVSGVNYKVTLITCDEYYNESAKSNEVTFTTL